MFAAKIDAAELALLSPWWTLALPLIPVLAFLGAPPRDTGGLRPSQPRFLPRCNGRCLAAGFARITTLDQSISR
jgi:hypothetical protein